jgi:hypothetical protein
MGGGGDAGSSMQRLPILANSVCELQKRRKRALDEKRGRNYTPTGNWIVLPPPPQKKSEMQKQSRSCSREVRLSLQISAEINPAFKV